MRNVCLGPKIASFSCFQEPLLSGKLSPKLDLSAAGADSGKTLVELRVKVRFVTGILLEEAGARYR
jgi:hypothetical protein